MSYRMLYVLSGLSAVVAAGMLCLLGYSLYYELWAAARVGAASAAASIFITWGFASIGRRLYRTHYAAAQRVLPSKLQLHLDSGELTEDEYRRVIALLEASREVE